MKIDIPSLAKPSLLYNAKQLEMGKKRMEEIGRKPPSPFTREKIKGFFTTWHLYTLVPCASCSSFS
jgi:MFS transporter, ACS family, pantothenate transporter